jgi:hypothetical protein
MRVGFGHLGEKQLLKNHSGTYNYTIQADGNVIFVSKSYNCLPFFFLQILVCALMTANFWHKAQAQLLPVTTAVLGNGNGVSYIGVPVLLNSVGGGTVAGVVPVISGVPVGTTGANGLTPNLLVSKILNVQ